jgi:hypothetical protein
MTDKRKRNTAVLCSDEVWARFQGLAVECGKTLPEFLGEVVEDPVALFSSDRQGTLADAVEETRVELVRRAFPRRTLIGFGQPVVRIR